MGLIVSTLLEGAGLCGLIFTGTRWGTRPPRAARMAAVDARKRAGEPLSTQTGLPSAL